MTITLELNAEQTDAINAAAARCGRESGEQWIQQDVISPAIATAVADAYNAAIARLGEAARGMDYAARLALIAQIEGQLA